MFAITCFVNLFCLRVVMMQKIFPIISDLEPLLLTQEQTINDLENIVIKKRRTIDYIENEIESYKGVHDIIKKDGKYFKNPFNIFTFQKRMVFNLEFIKNVTLEDTVLLKSERLKYPSHEDLNQAGRIITHLHEVYKLNATQLAGGLLSSAYSESEQQIIEYFLPMTSSDCFEISNIAKHEKKRISNKIRLLWLHEALRTFSKGGFDYGFSKFDIISGICECYDALDDSDNYMKWMQELLDIKPDYNSRELRLKINKHKNLLRNKQETQQTKHANIMKNTIIDPQKELVPCVEGVERQAFKMLCRGEVKVPWEVSSRLKCWYYVGRHPFTRLAPFRAELLYSKPDVILFHNVLSDKEIDTIKRIALPELDVTESMSYRLCKGMQIQQNETAGIEQVGQRISDFTGGLLAPIDMMSVSNYGVGGHYVTHVDSMNRLTKDDILKYRKYINDFTEENVSQLREMSQLFYRLATVLFYLSDVEQGGATAFPVLGLTVFPVKGAALFWTNMLPDLEIDYTTCHGACPVLRGSKWVASKWISADNQELNKPCTARITSRKIQYMPFPKIKE